MQRLADKTALITGANTGIGLAIAKTYAREGAKVVLAGRDDVAIQQIRVRNNGVLGGTAFGCHYDAFEEEDAKRAVEAAKERYGTLDICVANAGGTHWQRRPHYTEFRLKNGVGLWR